MAPVQAQQPNVTIHPPPAQPYPVQQYAPVQQQQQGYTQPAAPPPIGLPPAYGQVTKQ